MSSKLTSNKSSHKLEPCAYSDITTLFIFVGGNLSANEIKEIFALFDKSNRG